MRLRRCVTSVTPPSTRTTCCQRCTTSSTTPLRLPSTTVSCVSAPRRLAATVPLLLASTVLARTTTSLQVLVAPLAPSHRVPLVLVPLLVVPLPSCTPNRPISWLTTSTLLWESVA